MVEAPFLKYHKNRFYLFYSANDYYNSRYAIGYATSDKLAGPYVKPGGPWQDSSDSSAGDVSLDDLWRCFGLSILMSLCVFVQTRCLT